MKSRIPELGTYGSVGVRSAMSVSTRQVRTHAEMNGDPGRHGRCAAIEGWVYKRPCKAKNKDVLLRVP